MTTQPKTREDYERLEAERTSADEIRAQLDAAADRLLEGGK